MREPAKGADLGNMRSLGVRSLDVTCLTCGHHTSVNVDRFPDHVITQSLGRRMRCKKCGRLGASVRPDWSQMQGIPKGP
jgi:transcription elongation factor Elf1